MGYMQITGPPEKTLVHHSYSEMAPGQWSLVGKYVARGRSDFKLGGKNCGAFILEDQENRVHIIPYCTAIDAALGEDSGVRVGSEVLLEYKGKSEIHSRGGVAGKAALKFFRQELDVNVLTVPPRPEVFEPVPTANIY